MTQKFDMYDSLHKEFPKVVPQGFVGILLSQIGEGWYPLIREICKEVSTLDSPLAFTDFISADGMLQLKTDTGWWNPKEGRFAKIEELRKKSATICETCGKEGKVYQVLPKAFLPKATKDVSSFLYYQCICPECLFKVKLTACVEEGAPERKNLFMSEPSKEEKEARLLAAEKEGKEKEKVMAVWEKTGAKWEDCKAALEKSSGDIEKARDLLNLEMATRAK